jgi:putative RNA 2'-phosphotransferase
MDNRELVRLSKFLSLVLRHRPQKIRLTLDEQGWTPVDHLISQANRHGVPLTPAVLEQVVRQNDKQRFAFSEDGLRIRASQGHSIDIDLGLEPIKPPAVLYHGTAAHFLPSIREKGLIAGRRDHVHLSADEATALKVGQRHGRPVVLQVQAAEMHTAGHPFYRSANSVWLTAHVPTTFLLFPQPPEPS